MYRMKMNFKCSTSWKKLNDLVDTVMPGEGHMTLIDIISMCITLPKIPNDVQIEEIEKVIKDEYNKASNELVFESIKFAGYEWIHEVDV